jgi:hypothetical protein
VRRLLAGPATGGLVGRTGRDYGTKVGLSHQQTIFVDYLHRRVDVGRDLDGQFETLSEAVDLHKDV